MCETALPRSSFYAQRLGSNGLSAECRDCHNRRARASYRTKSRPRAKTLYQHAATRARKKGLPFSITIDWVKDRIEAGVCQVTGIPFQLTLTGQRNLYGPSLDRTDPQQGYTPENTRVVLFGYNALKNEATPAEAKGVILAMAGALA